MATTIFIGRQTGGRRPRNRGSGPGAGGRGCGRLHGRGFLPLDRLETVPAGGASQRPPAPGSWLPFKLLKDQAPVGPPETETVRERVLDLHGPRLVGNVVEIAERVRGFLIDGGRR